MCVDDADMVLSWRNHPEIRKFMLTQHEIPKEEHLKWFENAQHDADTRLQIFSDNGTPFGFINFKIEAEHQRADWGFYISPDAPKGSGMRMGKAALSYSVKYLKLHKLCGYALAFNSASIRFHKKMGFLQEAMLKQHVYVNGEFHDLISFGLIFSEFQGSGVSE